jgi:type I site-specific restriction endonuclease
MSILRPRDYQVEAIDAVIEAVERGTTRPVVLLPVGSGKTVTFAHLINKMNWLNKQQTKFVGSHPTWMWVLSKLSAMNSTRK